MGSGSFRREEDKTAFESLQAAADQPLINFPVDDVTSRAPATTKGMCVCCPKNTVSQGVCSGPCTWLVYALETLIYGMWCDYRSQIQLSLLFLKAREVPPKNLKIEFL